MLVVKVVKVKMVIFISGLCHLLTIYKYKIFIIVAVLTLLEIDFDQNDHDRNDRGLKVKNKKV